MNREDLNALPVFDEEGIASMRKMLGDEFESIVQEFIDTTPPLIESLQAAVESGQTDQIVSLAHRLKSGAGNLGLSAFFSICEYLEHRMRTGETVSYPETMAIINEQFQRIIEHKSR